MDAVAGAVGEGRGNVGSKLVGTSRRGVARAPRKVMRLPVVLVVVAALAAEMVLGIPEVAASSSPVVQRSESEPELTALDAPPAPDEVPQARPPAERDALEQGELAEVQGLVGDDDISPNPLLVAADSKGGRGEPPSALPEVEAVDRSLDPEHLAAEEEAMSAPNAVAEARPDGTTEVAMYAEAVQYRDAQGEWSAVDNSLVDDSRALGAGGTGADSRYGSVRNSV